MAKLEIIYHGYSEEELIEAAKLENPKADEDSFLPKMMMAYRRYGENALLGWDMGRARISYSGVILWVMFPWKRFWRSV